MFLGNNITFAPDTVFRDSFMKIKREAGVSPALSP